VQAQGRGLGDLTGVGPQERLAEQLRTGQRRWAGGQEPLQGLVSGLGVFPLVVDGLDPRGEQLVQPGQAGYGRQRAGRVELDEELLTDRPEQPLDLAPPGGLAGLAVGELDPQHRQGPQQLGGDHGRAVVEVDDLRDTPRGQARAQRGFEPDGVLAVAPPVAHEGSAVVVHEGEQERLAAGDHRPVQGITGPPVVRRGGLEPAERPRTQPTGAGVELEAAKCRCNVRCDGAAPPGPAEASRIALICAAVRAGTSRFNAAASSSVAADVVGSQCRVEGSRASNPPRRQVRIQRSRVTRETRMRSPDGPVCSRSASSRTSRPRALVDNAGSAASRISA